MWFLLAILPCVSALSSTGRAQTVVAANPVRKVVTLLQKLQKKVEEEGEAAEALYAKFSCYCQSSGGDLAASISAAEAKIPEIASSLKIAASRKQQLEDALASHQKDRSAAKAAIAEATAIRTKEKATYDKDLADNQANLAAVKKAAAAISQGMGSFLQTVDAGIVRKFVASSQNMPEADRQDVLSFLSGQQQNGYAPASGEIVGILTTLADEMAAAQKEMIATEQGSVADFEALVAAKKKEIATLSASIETKMGRVGELGVEIATLKNDGGDTAEALEADRKFAADLEKNCAAKAAVREEEKAARAKEVVALADTIKILNDDDALELFKKTLPSASASLLQVHESSQGQLVQARQLLGTVRDRSESRHRPRLDAILLALNGKKVGFDKVLKLIDGLVASLKAEQDDDDSKKAYCGVQFDQTKDKITGLTNSIEDTKAAVADAKDGLGNVVGEIAALQAGIAALDSALAEATANRKAEAAAYQELVTSNTAAKELILFAKNRLNKFYNPALYKAAPKRQLSEADQIFVNEGGDIPTAAPGGIANTGIEAFLQMTSKRSSAAPGPPPATAAAYSKNSQGSNGVIAMMDLLVKDLDQELAAAKVEEENASQEYTQMAADSADKRRGDSKSLLDKQAAKADLDGLLEKLHSGAKALGGELSGATKYLASLKGECDWLIQYYDVRKQARADEIGSLGNAKAVLSGADYSFVELTSRTRKFLRRM